MGVSKRIFFQGSPSRDFYACDSLACLNNAYATFFRYLSVAFCTQYRQSASLSRAEKAVKTPQHCGFFERATLVFCPTSPLKSAASVLSNHNSYHCRDQTDSPTHHTSDSISDKSARKTTSGACLQALVFLRPFFTFTAPFASVRIQGFFIRSLKITQ